MSRKQRMPMKRTARSHGLRGESSVRMPVNGEAAEENVEKSEQVRRRILDATLSCYVRYGWGGTNMSVISRELGMTRGMIQYYFPTLDDVLRASVSHLNSEWRKKYFSFISQEPDSGDRLGVGLKALWRLMQDPLNVARQELAAAARSNPALRSVMEQEAVFDEATTLDMAKQAYPDLARNDETSFQRALDFTVVFLEGLSRHPFSSDAGTRVDQLLAMLRSYLDIYWRERGVQLSSSPLVPIQPAAPPAVRDNSREQERQRALALILKAAAILSDRSEEGGLS